MFVFQQDTFSTRPLHAGVCSFLCKFLKPRWRKKHFSYELHPNEPEAETPRAGALALRALCVLLFQRFVHRQRSQSLSVVPSLLSPLCGPLSVVPSLRSPRWLLPRVTPASGSAALVMCQCRVAASTTVPLTLCKDLHPSVQDKPPVCGMSDLEVSGRQHLGGWSEKCKKGTEWGAAGRSCPLGSGFGILSPALLPVSVLGPCPRISVSCRASTYSTSRFRMVLPAARTSATLDTIGS